VARRTGKLFGPLPASLSDEVAAAWVERARAHIATLPPKVKKPKK
jgi:hypothetical protein